MKPDKELWNLPKDKHGRATVLERERAAGQELWNLTVHAANQRDETTRVFGLTTEQLKAIAAIVSEARK